MSLAGPAGDRQGLPDLCRARQGVSARPRAHPAGARPGTRPRRMRLSRTGRLRSEPAEFATLIEALGPFERRPRLAVAVSGGPDSMSLCLLAEAWARARGGEVSALTVDHGLRATSACEARQVGDWLSARGYRSSCADLDRPQARDRHPGSCPRRALPVARRLVPRGGRAAPPARATIRTIRRRPWRCARPAAAVPTAWPGWRRCASSTGLRLLRPLLGVPKARLLATLEAAGQPWLEDPSNLAPTFARGRLRAAVVLDAPRLARAAAEQAGCARRQRPPRCVLAGGACAHRPRRFRHRGARWPWQRAPYGVRRRAIRRHREERRRPRLPAARGAPGPACSNGSRPASQAAAPLAAAASCRGRASVLICREPRAIADEAPLVPGAPVLWDGRFRVELSGEAPALVVRALGRRRAARRSTRSPLPPTRRQLPAPVRPSLPSLMARR